MNNQLFKKQKEREWLEHFKSIYSDFPKGRIVVSESPDFIIKPNRKRTIGIELIQLILNKENFTQQNLLEGLKIVITKKNEKLKFYQKKILENYWLLITTDELGSIKFNLYNLLEKTNFESNFDRVFLFDTESEKVYEL